MSCTNELTKKIPAAKVALTILFVTFFNDNTKEEAVLYHCQIDHERRTFLKGKWETLGLSEYQLYGCSVAYNMITTFKSEQLLLEYSSLNHYFVVSVFCLRISFVSPKAMISLTCHIFWRLHAMQIRSIHFLVLVWHPFGTNQLPKSMLTCHQSLGNQSLGII